MSETTAASAQTEAAQAEAGDLGQALAALLRRYLEGARDAVTDLPGGPRGFQVLLNASGTDSSGTDCSNQATIAQRLGIDRTVMTYLVDDLEKAGMVQRRPDPADRRARQVVRTASGDQVLADASERIRRVEAFALGGLSTDDAAMLRRLVVSAAADLPPTDHSACDAPVC